MHDATERAFCAVKNIFRWDIIAFLSNQHWKWYKTAEIWIRCSEEIAISHTVCSTVELFFQRNDMFKFTGRTGSILPKWDAIKAGGWKPFICHITEHNHQLHGIWVSTAEHKIENCGVFFLDIRIKKTVHKLKFD